MTKLAVVAFDWGNTVQYDLAEYQHLGAMVHWPEVRAVPGIAAALSALFPHYRLAIATNAAMSTADQVRGALARSGLDGFFAHIWTARELGVPKPEPAYFEIVLRDLGVSASQVVMVGDTFASDIEGPRRCGLRTIWYNAAGLPVPEGSAPPDATIRNLDDLPGAVRALDEGRA